ncbi:tripartite tricarboxylate transporter TctB family protein [Tardiphaga alba]|uniref:Tripartite tricarboxylate transporter TctB family protein n=1 Tax=Tardiphaga alba TaxID=340268 RepID=A0ABX8A4F5_9BRAD|nr:tripartite tricarboxylate transporter TctB family protein [Tardiphaga alba]QUS38564.1 tripartite tricarboxylate transporter TctB family protein [Tardiphaga alba]
MSSTTRPPFRLNNSEFWTGVIGLGLGAFVINSGLKLKLGTINDPGSGFMMFYIGLMMCAFAVGIILASVTEGGPTFGSRWEDARWSKPVLIIVCLIAYAFALEPLGFLVATIPLMLLLLRIIDPVRWTLAIPLAVLAPVGVWWVLKHGLAIMLPTGTFEIG